MFMRIGIITAMAEEMMPIYNQLGNVVAESNIHGAHILQVEIESDTIYLATCGIGEINAAATAQTLVDLFDIEVLLNFGFVGTLRSNINVGELVIADRVCHYQYDTSLIDGTTAGQYTDNKDRYFYLDGSLIDRVLSAIGKPVKKVAVASGDVFVATEMQKKKLADQFECDICDMELAGLAIVCRRNNVPLLSIKVVSDKADDMAPINFDTVVSNGLSKYEEILPSVIKAVTGKVAPLPPITQ